MAQLESSKVCYYFKPLYVIPSVDRVTDEVAQPKQPDSPECTADTESVTRGVVEEGDSNHQHKVILLRMLQALIKLVPNSLHQFPLQLPGTNRT